MKEATLLIAAVLALGLGAVAAHEDDTLQDDELQAAQHSRDFALQQFQLRACHPGETAVWVADKEADCLREVQP